MPKLVHVTVEYSRTIQTAPYESKSAKASIGYAFAEDEVITAEAASAAAMKVAVEQVEKTVYGKTNSNPSASGAAPNVAGTAEGGSASQASTAPTEEKRKPGRPKKDAGEQAPPQGQTQTTEAPQQSSPAPAATNPVTDGDLNKACGQATARLREAGDQQGMAKVKAVRDEFCAGTKEPFVVANIPQEKRGAFIKALEALTPGTAAAKEEAPSY